MSQVVGGNQILNADPELAGNDRQGLAGLYAVRLRYRQVDPVAGEDPVLMRNVWIAGHQLGDGGAVLPGNASERFTTPYRVVV
jgi:hypothetical protein